MGLTPRSNQHNYEDWSGLIDPARQIFKYGAYPRGIEVIGTPRFGYIKSASASIDINELNGNLDGGESGTDLLPPHTSVQYASFDIGHVTVDSFFGILPDQDGRIMEIDKAKALAHTVFNQLTDKQYIPDHFR